MLLNPRKHHSHLCDMRFFPAIFLLLFVFIVPGGAQEAVAPPPQLASVSGTVTDTEQAVIPGAQVTLNGPGANMPRTAVADESGAFNFAGLQPG